MAKKDELLSAIDNSELAADDLRAVYTEVHTLAGRWRAMCLSLGLSDSEMEITAATYPNNPHDCFREVILKWLKKVYNFQRYGPPTWRMLIEAVADPAGGNDPALAERIAKAHQAAVVFPPTPSSLQAAVGSSGRITIPAHQQQQLDPQETHYLGHLVSRRDTSTEDGSHARSSGLVTDKGYHPTSETGSTTEENQFPYLDMTALSQEEKDTLKGRLREESMQIMLKFQKLVNTFQNSLKHQNVPINMIADHLTYLGAFTAVKCQRPLLEDCLPDVRAAPTVDDAFWILRHYSSFFNYYVIEHIIESLGTEDDKSNLQKYKEDLKQYSKRRCYECPSCLAQPSDVGTKLILKLDVSFEPYSVEQLQIFKYRLSQILQISEGALKLCYIEEGCIQLTFQIPSFMEKEIFPLSYEEETALINEGVLDLRCGEYEFSAKAWKSANALPSMSQLSRRAAEGTSASCQSQSSEEPSMVTIPDASSGGGAERSCVDDSNLINITSPNSLPDAVEELHRPTFRCGCGKCSLSNFTKQGCPKPVPTESVFQYLNVEGLSESQKTNLIGRLYKEFEDITIAFSSLVTHTKKSLILRGVLAKELIEVLADLGAFQPTRPQKPLLEDRFEEMITINDIGQIFSRILREYWSFFSYHIIEHIVNNLGSEEDRERLKQYKARFNVYCKRSIFECPAYSLPKPHHANLVMKVSLKLDQWNIIHLYKLQSRISEIIGVSECTPRLCTVEKGCFQLRSQLPCSIAELIFPLSDGQDAVLAAEGVTYLSCDWNDQHFELSLKEQPVEAEPLQDQDGLDLTPVEKTNVSRYLLHLFHQSLETDPERAVEFLCQAIILAVEDPVCAENLQEVKFQQTIVTQLLERLLSKKESTARHVDFVLHEILQAKPLFDASQLQASQFLSKADIKKELFLSLIEAGMVVKASDLPDVVKILSDDNTDLVQLLATQSNAQMEDLNLAFRVAAQAKKIILSADLIKLGAKPDLNEVKVLVETTSFPPASLTDYLAQCLSNNEATNFTVSSSNAREMVDILKLEDVHVHDSTAEVEVEDGQVDDEQAILSRYISSLKEKDESYFLETQNLESDSENDNVSDSELSLISDVTMTSTGSAISTDSGYLSGTAQAVTIDPQQKKTVSSDIIPVPEELTPKPQPISESEPPVWYDFENLIWEVEFTPKVLKFLKHKKVPKKLRLAIISAVHELASVKEPQRLPHVHKVRAKLPPAQLHLFKRIIITQSAPIQMLWEKAVQFSPKNTTTGEEPHFRDTIRVWAFAKNQKELQYYAGMVEQAYRRASKEAKKAQHTLKKISQPSESPAHFVSTTSSEDFDTMKFIPPACLQPNEHNIMVFHEVLTSAVKTLLTSDNSKYDFPLKPSAEEYEIIALKSEEAIILHGRSGTGKTTCCLYRLWNQFKNYWGNLSLSEEDSLPQGTPHLPEHLHQVFLTKNPFLCCEVKKTFYRLAAACDYTEKHLQFRNQRLLPKIADINDYAYPLFLTARQFWCLLDRTLEGKQFFPEEVSAKIIACEATVESEFSSELLRKSHKPPASVEVTSTYFEEQIWKHIWKKPNLKCHYKQRDIDPLLVWMEIKSFIKGSAQALRSEEGELSQEQYIHGHGLPSPNFTDDDLRSDVYKLYDAYKWHRRAKRYEAKLYDECDLVHSLYRRLHDHGNSWSMHSFYIDEVQDFTQAELLLVFRSCKDPNSLFLTGDTAQSIMRDVAFRFQDVQSQFMKFKDVTGVAVKQPITYYLGFNYRSHTGILELAKSVLDLLFNYFPTSVDAVPQDIGLFQGPYPVLIESCKEEELALLLARNKRKPSAIEFGHHQAIIVHSEQSKKKLPKELMYAGMVFTIFEAKGLEFDDVLLFNFFEESRVDEAWLLATLYLKNHQDLICDKLEPFGKPRVRKDMNEKQNMSLNAELKHLYTAITRAKCNLWIYDSNSKKRQPIFDYWHKRGLVKVAGLTQEDEEMAFVAPSSPQQWKSQGDFLKKREKWEQAMHCYQKAGRHDLQMEVYDIFLAENEQIPHLQVALECLEYDRLQHNAKLLKIAATHIMKAQKYSEAAQLFEMLNKEEETVEAYLEIKDYESAVRVKERFHKHSEAIEMLLHGKRRLDALEKAQKYEFYGIQLKTGLGSDDLAKKLIMLYDANKEEKSYLYEVVRFVKDPDQRPAILKYAKHYDDAYSLHLKFHQYEEAIRLVEARGWYERGTQLAMEQGNRQVQSRLVIQKAKFQLKSTQELDPHTSLQLNEIAQMDHTEVLTQILANLLLARSSQDPEKCEIAVCLCKKHSILPGEVEALCLLSKSLAKRRQHQMKSSPSSSNISHKERSVYKDLATKAQILHFTLSVSDSASPYHETMLKHCELLYGFRRVEDDKFYRKNVELSQQLQPHEVQPRHHSMSTEGYSEAKSLERPEDFYLLPNYSQDIWIGLTEDEHQEKHSDLDGMCLFDKKTVHSAIVVHFWKYFQMAIQQIYRWIRDAPFSELLTMESSTVPVWDFSYERLNEYIEFSTLVINLILYSKSEPFPYDPNESHVLEPHEFETIQDALLLGINSLQMSVYLPLSKECLVSLVAPENALLLAQLRNRCQSKKLTYIQQPDDADQMIQVWQECRVLKSSTNGISDRLFKTWVHFCKNIKKPSEVVNACEKFLREFLPEATGIQSKIPQRNVVNAICIPVIALVATAECYTYRQSWPPLQTPCVVLPQVYKYVIEVFDDLSAFYYPHHHGVLSACAQYNATYKHHKENSSKCHKENSYEVLCYALDFLVTRQPSILHQLLTNEEALKNDSARLCLILVLVLFVNISLFNDNTTQIYQYYQAILNVFPEKWCPSKAVRQVECLHTAALLFNKATNVKDVCEILHHLLDLSDKSEKHLRLRTLCYDASKLRLVFWPLFNYPIKKFCTDEAIDYERDQAQTDAIITEQRSELRPELQFKMQEADPTLVGKTFCMVCAVTLVPEPLQGAEESEETEQSISLSADDWGDSEPYQFHITSESHKRKVVAHRKFKEELEWYYTPLRKELSDMRQQCLSVEVPPPSLVRVIDDVNDDLEKYERRLSELQDSCSWEHGIEELNAMIDWMQFLLTRSTQEYNKIPPIAAQPTVTVWQQKYNTPFSVNDTAVKREGRFRISGSFTKAYKMPVMSKQKAYEPCQQFKSALNLHYTPVKEELSAMCRWCSACSLTLDADMIAEEIERNEERISTLDKKHLWKCGIQEINEMVSRMLYLLQKSEKKVRQLEEQEVDAVDNYCYHKLQLEDNYYRRKDSLEKKKRRCGKKRSDNNMTGDYYYYDVQLKRQKGQLIVIKRKTINRKKKRVKTTTYRSTPLQVTRKQRKQRILRRRRVQLLSLVLSKHYLYYNISTEWSKK